jgi:hypothetical protein
MNLDDALGCLESEWRDYLEERGHRIHYIGSCFRILKSRNGKKGQYRWLLVVGHSSKRSLSESELSDIRQHLRQAKKQKEATYIVAGFLQEPGRIIVLPAKAALRAPCISSDKGGIAWED